MRIIIFDNAYWNILNFRGDLVKSLIQNKHELIAVAPRSPIFQEELEKLGVTCIPIGFKVNAINPVSDLFLCLRILMFFMKYSKPDVVLTYTIKPNLYVTLVGKLFGLKVINNISGLGSVFINKSIITKIVLIIYKVVFSFSYWIFFQNKHDLAFFKTKNFLNENYSVIPGSGVNLELFKHERLKNPGKKFLFVGRIIGEKGIRELVKAAHELTQEFHDLIFYFVGEVGYKNVSAIPTSEVEQWKVNNANFHFMGKVHNIREYYELVDIMVLPSYREGLSKSLIEASAMSLPIITTNVPGCSDVVTDGENGLLVQVKSSEDLLDKMRTIVLMDETYRIKMGSTAKYVAIKKFDVQIVIEAYLQVINIIK
ncbi:glycosyltransferase involved in cell wall biosynthesis [Algoriphagus ratkowskyi]|uniref:Glycosyltransferase family 4 protein n=1 Tax=Algoriphagus ratkowskyi TaxID=57028 RepID=A0A2W7QVW1_9BACT|nr:glycosyltransferase family 4 protein [Algoriphagus ratkowskyi]PZX50260.1 glycosyltransferase involved in cell wall biosynthesis [Algoriphagus ratkowskyi]TXD75612.1 glycosyltransferase family 4 protein [Algoriphagus ratkowskyi]